MKIEYNIKKRDVIRLQVVILNYLKYFYNQILGAEDLVNQVNLQDLSIIVFNKLKKFEEKPSDKKIKLTVDINLIHSVYSTYYEHPFFLKDQPLDNVIICEFLEPLNKKVNGNSQARRNVHTS